MMDAQMSHAISAIAIAAGLVTSPLSAGFARHSEQCGDVELYLKIAGLAAVSAGLAGEIATCPEFQDTGFPGGYLYEVDEELGAWIAARLAATPPLESFDGPEVRAELGRLALVFFERPGRAIPLTRALVEKWTGYRALAAA